MGAIFYLAGLLASFYFGFIQKDWYWLFIGSGLMVVGYVIIRAPQLHKAVTENGFGFFIKMLPLQVIIMSLITAPVYFAGKLFG